MYQIELLNFLHIVAKEDLKFCILCWKTSKDRAVVGTKDLITFLEIVAHNTLDKSALQDLVICCYCNAHVKRAIKLLRNWSTSSKLMTFMQSIKKGEHGPVFRAIDSYGYGKESFPDNLSLQKWRHNTILFCNSKIPAMKCFSELVTVNSLLLDTTLEGTPSVEQYVEMAKHNTNMTVTEDHNDIVIIENSIDAAVQAEPTPEAVYIIDDDPPDPRPTPVLTLRPVTGHDELSAYMDAPPAREASKVLVVQTRDQLVAHPVVCARDLHAVPSLDCKLLDNVLIPLSASERAALPPAADQIIINHVDVDLIISSLNSSGMPMFQVGFDALDRYIQTDGVVKLQNNVLYLNRKPPSRDPDVSPGDRLADPLLATIRPTKPNNRPRKPQMKVTDFIEQLNNSSPPAIPPTPRPVPSRTHSPADLADPRTTAPQPIQSPLVDWEVKIPMDVITYTDAVDPCPDERLVPGPRRRAGAAGAGSAGDKRRRALHAVSYDIVEID